MVYSLSYRRPAYVSKRPSSTSSESLSDSLRSSGSTTPAGIPDALSFDRIIGGGTCPPCTLRDFMNYLLYIEFAAENLQFYMWFRDYVQRFNALPEVEKSLASPVDLEKQELEAVATPKTPKTPKIFTKEVATVFSGTDFSAPATTTSEKGVNPFETAEVFDENMSTVSPWSDDASTLKSSKKTDHRALAANAYESADVKVQPFTIQPFREEITRVIGTYIADGAPRQLNLSSKERSGLMRNLASTTHPSAFSSVLRTIEWTLRHQAHPNFIRWTICNGNKPRWIFARGLGISLIAIGLVVISLITASSVSRPWRVLAVFPILLGISTLFAAWKGMCVVLHGFHHRHLRPWELFVDQDEASSIYELKKGSFDSFGSANSYEDEPWVVNYQKRNVIRKIFDREVWVQEPALRQIQDTIFLQSLLLAAVITAIIVGVFCAIPRGNRY